MGAGWPTPAEASGQPTTATTSAEPTPLPGEADPASVPIPEEPSPLLVAQREWYDTQDKIFQGIIPPEIPWQDDDLSAQQSSSASQQPTAAKDHTEPTAPDQEPWLMPKPNTRLFKHFRRLLRDSGPQGENRQKVRCLTASSEIRQEPINSL